MKGSELSANNKAEFADYCEAVYLDTELSKKQITNRIGNRCKRELKHLSISMNKLVVGKNSDWHFELNEDASLGIHTVSKILGEYRDAIKALDMKHHNIDMQLSRAVKHLAEYLPDIASLLKVSLPLAELRTNLTKLRKSERRPLIKAQLKHIRIEHHAFYLLQDAYEWSRRMATANDEANLKEKVRHQIKVNPDFVVHTAKTIISEMMAKTRKMDYPELAVAIAMATGRRRSEIMKTAQFKVTQTTSDDHVMFSGQLKTKDRRLFDDVVPYAIPVLVPPQLVIDGLALLRQLQANHTITYADARGQTVTLMDKKGQPILNDDGEPVVDIPVLSKGVDDVYHNEAVSSFYASVLNTRARQIFDCADVEFRITRDIYGLISYESFKHDGEGHSVYRTRIYGHSGNAQQHYEKIELDSSIERIEYPNTDEPAKQYHKALIKALSEFDNDINAYLRSPNYAIIHRWVKTQLSEGLSADSITPSYIRRHCMVNGKMLNFNTIKQYYACDDDSKITVNYPQLLAQFGDKLSKLPVANKLEKTTEETTDKAKTKPDPKKAAQPKATPPKKAAKAEAKTPSPKKTVKAVEPPAPATNKPTDKPHIQIASDKKTGLWQVDIRQGAEHFVMDDLPMKDHSRTAAMRAAWERFKNEANTQSKAKSDLKPKAKPKAKPVKKAAPADNKNHSLPKRMPKPVFTELDNGQTQVKVVHKGQTLVEITTQGSHALLTTQAKLLYQSLIDTEVE